MTAVEYYGLAILTLGLGGLAFFIAIHVGMFIATLNIGTVIEVD